LIMFVLIFVAPMLTALSVVREKETGSIYNVASSTLPRLHFLLGKLLPTVAITMINTAVLWALATGLFGAPFRGSLAFFALGSLVYVVCITGLGLLLSLLVRTQVAAMIIAVMISNVIGTQYSGMLRPISSLSGVPWWLAHLTPPMYYLEIVHGTFLKGLGASELWQEALVLFVYAAVVLAAAFLLFRKRTRA
jgi:ABC-2 type transport system permease protein